MSGYMCLCQLNFYDDGEPEFMVFCRGTLAECKQMFDLVPAVSYNGIRPLKDARVKIVAEIEAAP